MLIFMYLVNDFGSIMVEIAFICWQILENIEAIKSKSVERHAINVLLWVEHVSPVNPSTKTAPTSGIVQVYQIKYGNSISNSHLSESVYK